MNKIIVIGNLGRDPEMRYTPGGQGVTSFSVASSCKYTTADGEQRDIEAPLKKIEELGHLNTETPGEATGGLLL